MCQQTIVFLAFCCGAGPLIAQAPEHGGWQVPRLVPQLGGLGIGITIGSGEVLSVSSDGRIVAAVSDEDGITLWDTASGMMFRRIADGDGEAVALSNDGSRVVSRLRSLSGSRAFGVWDVVSGELLPRVLSESDVGWRKLRPDTLQRTMSGAEAASNGVALDDSRVAVGLDDGVVGLIETRRGAILNTQSIGTRVISDMARLDGERIAVAYPGNCYVGGSSGGIVIVSATDLSILEHLSLEHEEYQLRRQSRSIWHA